MTLFLLMVAIIVMASAYNNTHRDLFALLKDDFSGSGNFFVWVAAIAIVSGIGSYKPLRPISNAMLVLIVIAIIVSNNKHGTNIFNSFANQIRQGTGY